MCKLADFIAHRAAKAKQDKENLPSSFFSGERTQIPWLISSQCNAGSVPSVPYPIRSFSRKMGLAHPKLAQNARHLQKPDAASTAKSAKTRRAKVNKRENMGARTHG